jgi:predicted RNA-binding protein with RPS1 domain
MQLPEGRTFSEKRRKVVAPMSDPPSNSAPNAEPQTPATEPQTTQPEAAKPQAVVEQPVEAETAEPQAAAAAEAPAAEPQAVVEEPVEAETAGPQAAAEPQTAEPQAVAEQPVKAETAEPQAAAEAPAAAKPPAKPPAKAKKKARAKAAAPAPMAQESAGLVQAHEKETAVEGKVIGWNNGGFHILVGEFTAFCPKSEMEIGQAKAPKSYLDKSFLFAVLKIEESGRRVVLSRAALLRNERQQQRGAMRAKLEVGAVREGKVASLTDFGAFVDLGGVQGLVHVSEISRRRVEKPEEVLSVGQTVQVKILKVEQGGKRISLSMKALEPDPWEGVRKRFSEGEVVRGTVEKVAPFGAFVTLEPGLTGLLPTASLSLPRGSSLARVFPPGKEISVQILAVDPRRKRISLAPEGSKTEGTRADFESFKKQGDAGDGFNALALALEKARRSAR